MDWVGPVWVTSVLSADLNANLVPKPPHVHTQMYDEHLVPFSLAKLTQNEPAQMPLALSGPPSSPLWEVEPGAPRGLLLQQRETSVLFSSPGGSRAWSICGSVGAHPTRGE